MSLRGRRAGNPAPPSPWAPFLVGPGVPLSALACAHRASWSQSQVCPLRPDPIPPFPEAELACCYLRDFSGNPPGPRWVAPGAGHTHRNPAHSKLGPFQKLSVMVGVLFILNHL